MIYFAGIVGAWVMLDASTDLDNHVQPSGIIQLAIGAVLFLAAVVGWFLRRGWDSE